MAVAVAGRRHSRPSAKDAGLTSRRFDWRPLIHRAAALFSFSLLTTSAIRLPPSVSGEYFFRHRLSDVNDEHVYRESSLI